MIRRLRGTGGSSRSGLDQPGSLIQPVVDHAGQLIQPAVDHASPLVQQRLDQTAGWSRRCWTKPAGPAPARSRHGRGLDQTRADNATSRSRPTLTLAIHRQTRMDHGRWTSPIPADPSLFATSDQQAAGPTGWSERVNHGALVHPHDGPWGWTNDAWSSLGPAGPGPTVRTPGLVQDLCPAGSDRYQRSGRVAQRILKKDRWAWSKSVLFPSRASRTRREATCTRQQGRSA
jgi:hypothetical protein